MCSGANPAGALFSLLGTANQFNSVGQEGFARINEDQTNENMARAAELDAVQRGQIAATNVRLKGAQLAGEQKVAYASSGVDPTRGTAAQVQGATAALTELDAQTATNNAAREAWGYGKKAEQFARQGVLDRSRVTSEMNSTILGGMAKFAGSSTRGGGEGE